MRLAASLLIATSLAALSNADQPEQTEEPGRVMVVLDASGSMWGQIDGRTKIEIVRDAFSSLAQKWEGRAIDAGLVAYGHRRKGDCADIELLANSAPVDASELSRTVNALTPKGKTPLGDAVRTAAETLKYTEDKATVILLSDGVENCGVDTCALGKELSDNGIDFTAHVVGFDIQSDEATRQLSCLADNTGGLYVTAGNAAELGDALSRTSEASLDLDYLALARLADTGEPAGTTQWVLRQGVKVFEVQTLSARLSGADADEFNLSEGPIKIEASYDQYSGSVDASWPVDDELIVTLQRQAPDITLSVVGDIASQSEFLVEWTGKASDSDRIALVRTGANPQGQDVLASAPVSVPNSDTGGGTATLVASAEPGEYELVFVHDFYGLRRIDARIPVTIGNVELSLVPQGEIWAGENFRVNWTGPGLAEKDMIAIGPRTQGSSDYSSLKWIKAGQNFVELKAPAEPGDYELRYYVSGYDIIHIQPVTVK